jgi:uncharacterized protein DUF1761
MDLITFHLDKVNWVAVVVAVLPSFVIGSIWYTPAVFGNYWMKQVGLKKKDAENVNMVKFLSLTAVLTFVMVTALATLMCALDLTTPVQGAVFGGLVSLTFSATTRGIHQLFEQKGLGLFLVNVGHDVLFLATAGAIIGAF